jgi:hypothetical protein
LLGLIRDAALAEESARVCGEDDEECHAERRLAASTSPVEGFTQAPTQSNDEKNSAVDHAACMMSELESLSSLFDVSCGTEAMGAVHYHSRDSPASDEYGYIDMDEQEGCVDTDLLLNKTFVALAMADPRVWESPHFLFRYNKCSWLAMSGPCPLLHVDLVCCLKRFEHCLLLLIICKREGAFLRFNPE